MSHGIILVTFLCLISGRDAFFHPPTSHGVCSSIQRQNSRSLLLCSSNSDEPPKRKVIRQQLPKDLPIKTSIPVVTGKSNSGSTVKSILMGQPIRTVRRVSPLDQLKYSLTDVWLQIKSFFVRLVTALQTNLQASRMRVEERLHDARLRLLEWLREDDKDDKNKGGSDGMERPYREETDTTLTDSDGVAAAVEGVYENDDNVLDHSLTKRITHPVPISPEKERKELQRKANSEYAKRKLLEIEMLEKDNASSKEMRENRRKARDTYAERKLQEIEALEQRGTKTDSRRIIDSSNNNPSPSPSVSLISNPISTFTSTLSSSTTNSPVTTTALAESHMSDTVNTITSPSIPAPSLGAFADESASPGPGADPTSPDRGAAAATPSSSSSSSASNTGE